MNDIANGDNGHALEAGKLIQELCCIGIIGLIVHPCEGLLELLLNGGPLPGLGAFPERSLRFTVEEVAKFVQVALKVIPCFLLAAF